MIKIFSISLLVTLFFWASMQTSRATAITPPHLEPLNLYCLANNPSATQHPITNSCGICSAPPSAFVVTADLATYYCTDGDDRGDGDSAGGHEGQED